MSQNHHVPRALHFCPYLLMHCLKSSSYNENTKKPVIIVMLIKSGKIHVKVKKFHSLFVLLEYLPSAILQENVLRAV